MYANPPSRTSASSSESTNTRHSGRSWQAPARTQGDVPTAVRSLLVATKQLQESLKQWSLGQATETQVSDIFVQIGTNFNSTIRAFAQYHINLSDMYSIPQELREVLEQCLAEDPSPQALAMYMPEVRQVLYKLLKGLQMRQEAWRVADSQQPQIPPGSR